VPVGPATIADESVGFRPPDGREILFLDAPTGGNRGIYAFDVASGETRTILEPSWALDAFGASWSPDGEQVLFHRFDRITEGIRKRAYIVGADGTGERRLLESTTPGYDGSEGWSNDGTRQVIGTGLPDGSQERIAILRVGDGSSVELQCGTNGPLPCADSWLWSPDDTTLLGMRTEEDGTVRHLLADPATGAVSTAPWVPGGGPSWQRAGSQAWPPAGQRW
jgi:Tol biopolymer transport system component